MKVPREHKYIMDLYTMDLIVLRGDMFVTCEVNY